MRNWENWARAAGIRALKTAAQTAAATIGTTAALSSVDWKLAGIISMLTSVAGIPEE